MGDYDYLNARIRGMSRELLSPDFIDQILRAEGEQIMIDVLMNSAYGPYLSEALVSERGLAAAETALRRNLFETLTKVRNIAPPGPRTLIEIQLNRWDVVNIVTLLRGKAARLPLEEIITGFTPAGQFHPVQLADLAAEPDIPSLANSLTSWGYEFASIVRRAIHAHGGEIDLATLEADLYLQYFLWAFSQLNEADENEAILLNFLRLQVDLSNVITVLKQVEYRSNDMPVPDVSLLPGGTLGRHVLKSLNESKNVEFALEVLAQTFFGPGVERGILAFGEFNRLSDIERFLEAVVIERGAKFFRNDPLTAAVPLGYIWRKVCEYQNVRALLRGKRYHIPPNAIREVLVLV